MEQDAQTQPTSGQELAIPSTFSSLSTASSNALTCVPSMEEGVKYSGGAVAALLAMRYAGSFRSACVVGLLSGLFAHSLYADVLRKKRRRRSAKRHEEEGEETTDSS